MACYSSTAIVLLKKKNPILLKERNLIRIHTRESFGLYEENTEIHEKLDDGRKLKFLSIWMWYHKNRLWIQSVYFAVVAAAADLFFSFRSRFWMEDRKKMCHCHHMRWMNGWMNERTNEYKIKTTAAAATTTTIPNDFNKTSIHKNHRKKTLNDCKNFLASG